MHAAVVVAGSAVGALPAVLGFVRTHRGELVNRHRVWALEGSAVVLSDGQRARVSRRSAPRVRRLLPESHASKGPRASTGA